MKSDLDNAVERLGRDLRIAIGRSERRFTLRAIGIVGAFKAVLFALLCFVH